MSSTSANRKPSPISGQAIRTGVRKAGGFGIRAAAAGAMSIVFLAMPSVKGVE